MAERLSYGKNAVPPLFTQHNAAREDWSELPLKQRGNRRTIKPTIHPALPPDADDPPMLNVERDGAFLAPHALLFLLEGRDYEGGFFMLRTDLPEIITETLPGP